MTRAFLPLLLEGEAAGDKTIVNVSSVGAHLTMRGASSYQMSKLALLRFTEFVVKEYGDRGVVAFAVDPGGVRTELAGRMPVETHGGEFFFISVLCLRGLLVWVWEVGWLVWLMMM